MTSTVKKTFTKNKYPCLLKYKDSDLIILATDESADKRFIAGVVVGEDLVVQSNYKLGFIGSDWIASLFEPFYGEITLKS